MFSFIILLNKFIYTRKQKDLVMAAQYCVIS